jgi:N-carbamoyl-L-amino-acid hydrolase
LPLTLDQLNRAPAAEFAALLAGTCEHSPWVVERAFAARPFATLAALKVALVQVVRDAGADAQLALLRAHPELAGRALANATLTRESTHEQSSAGLNRLTADDLGKLRRLNAEYQARFGFPFILAVRGPRGQGVAKDAIIATFERRLHNHPDFERAEALRNVHRVVELRLAEKLGHVPERGNRVWDWAETLARDSDSASGELTVTYLTPAHRAVAQRLLHWMRDECGFDEAGIDAVGNVVGVYHGTEGHAPRLLTGSHYDTVRNAGKYDGRLGILVPMACVRDLSRQRRRLPFGLEVVGFAEEEGQRYPAVFLGSSALTGRFDGRWLDQRDADGVTMRDAMATAGLVPDEIPALARDPARYLAFVEVHIEQGPVLTDADLPLGVVTSINGSVRYAGEIVGIASHAGTTPMHHRRDAAAAAAELVSYAERRGAGAPDLVATVGVLEVPNGSINVVPGRCRFSLDVRATTDVVRDECAADIGHELAAICARRGVRFELTQTMSASAARCADPWRERWEHAVAALGLPIRRLPSGAGHDAMKLAEIMPQAMLFVRGQNGGISHNPLEAITNDDADLAVQAFANLLDGLAAEP